MNQIKLLTLAEINSAIAAQQADLAAIGATLEQKLAAGPIAAQAKRLVAMGLAREADHILKQAANTAQYLVLKAKPTDEDDTSQDGVAEEGGEGLLSEVIELVAGIADAIAENLGVAPAAVLPFILECNSIMLASSANLIERAKVKLHEADAGEANQTPTP